MGTSLLGVYLKNEANETETDAELELRLAASGRKRVLGQIEKIRSQLNGLEDQLDIFNTYGLKIITENLDSIESRMFTVALEQKEGR
jgi:hypothetical protein